MYLLECSVSSFSETEPGDLCIGGEEPQYKGVFLEQNMLKHVTYYLIGCPQALRKEIPIY